MSFTDTLPLPSHTEPYEFQVAGHSHANMTNICLLKDPCKPRVYKLFQDLERGMREVAFYRKVFAIGAPNYLQLLRKFIPNYYGIFRCNVTKTLYLGLEDLLNDFNKPHICDLKLGTISYLPDSSIEKVYREKTKYIWRPELGVLISGMQIYDWQSCCFIKFPTTFGRSLNPQQIYSVGLLTFLGPDHTYRKKLASCYLTKLNDLLNWYTLHGAKQLTFCRSSVLLIHESSPALKAKTTATSMEISSLSSDSFPPNAPVDGSCHVDVFLIDFAHWSEKRSFSSSSPSSSSAAAAPPTTDSQSYWQCQLTHGFRHGLSTLIGLMGQVLALNKSTDTQSNGSIMDNWSDTPLSM